ncbi:putative sulfate exporter family transporter, partial [Gammaproteobacteria bacterium]|nr:putative sulfate exporter family transporter [Gammaproteobacteria bacterium]
GLLLIIISAYTGSAFISLLLGVVFAYSFNLSEQFITKSIGSKLIQLGIILLAFSIPLYDAYELTRTFLPSISVFVILIFILGLLLGRFLKVDKNQTILIASGTAICGATAIAAIAPILKAKPKIIIASISLVFLLNAFGLIAFPLLATYLNMSQDFFGAWAALAIHDTASVVGAAMTYGQDSVEMATTIKLTRTLWLIPLMVVLSISYNKKTMLKLPIFVSIFICTLILSNYLVLTDTVDNLIKAISSICLFTGLFCIGTSIDKESIKIFDKKLITLAISLWMIAILISYILVSYLI